mgnify:CR=1 FL=1
MNLQFIALEDIDNIHLLEDVHKQVIYALEGLETQTLIDLHDRVVVELLWLLLLRFLAP